MTNRIVWFVVLLLRNVTVRLYVPGAYAEIVSVN